MKHIIFISFILFAVITGEATAKEKEPTTKGKEAAAKEKVLTDKELQAMVKEALGKGKEATAKKMEATAKEMDATTKKMEALTKKMEAMAKEQEQQEPLQTLIIPQVIQEADPLINQGPNKGPDKGPNKSLTVAPAVAAACAGTQITDALGTNEVDTVTFFAVGSGRTVTVAGLTYTNPGPGNNSAAVVATAFANRSSGYTGTGNLSGTLSGWSSGPRLPPNQVAFTSINPGNVTNIVTSATGGASTPSVTVTTEATSGGSVTLNTLLTNHTVCEVAGDAAAAGPDQKWGVQEEHRTGGALWDYKRGPASTIDPPTHTGNWSISGSGTGTVVNYTYLGGGGSGSYTVFDNLNGTYDFCNGTNRVATVTVVNSINTGCPGFAHGAP
jgi:hypothetical protein